MITVTIMIEVAMKEYPAQFYFHDMLGEEVEDVEEEIETIDWDVKIEQLPPRHSEQVVVRFTQGSYRPPRIVDDPED